MNNDLIAKLKNDGTIDFVSKTRLYQGSASYYKLTIESVKNIESGSIMYISFRREDGQETSIMPMTRIGDTNSFYFNLNSQWYFYVSGNLYFNIQIRKQLSETEQQVISQANSSLYINAVSGFNAPAPLLPQAVDIIEQSIIDLRGDLESDITNLENSKVDKTTKVNNKALQSDITLTADDIKGKDALNQEMTIQEVLDSKMDDTQLAQVIDDNEHKAPSNKAVNTVKNTLDTKIDNVENTLDTKIDGVESDIKQELDTVAYLGALSEEEELMRTVYNAEKLGGKTESELSVASALNSTKLNNKLESELSVASAVNSAKLNNKQESELSVASAVNSAKLNNKQESELNVASALDSDKLGGVLASEYSKKNIVLFNGEHKSKIFSNEELKNNVNDGRIEVIPYYEKYKRVKLEFKDGALSLDYNYDETMGEKVLKFNYDFSYTDLLGDVIVRKGIFYVVLNYRTLQFGENPPIGYAFYPKTITNCQFLNISDDQDVEKPVPTEVYVSISKTDTQLIINDIRFNTIVEFSTLQDIIGYNFTITKIEEIRG